MTPSFDRGEAGRAHDVGRTDGAARVGQGCPISNFSADVHSTPNTVSGGPAALTPIFPLQGHPIHPGLVSLPGSQSVLESLGHPRRRFLPAEAPCRRALSPDSGRGGISLHLDRCSSPLATKGDA